MDYSKLLVPVSVQTVNHFVANNTGMLEETLRDIREMITWAVRAERVVKIYGREDRQGGDKFKDVRKISGKFNSYHRDKSNDHGSLWEIPDIIGFTVVVSYPSDVVAISKIIDGLVGQGSIRAEKIRGEQNDDRDKAPIEIDPEYGRVLADKGYFAVHYNVRPNAYTQSTTPICEVQIKTAMHDAWGAKTHDLIYKAPVAFDRNLLKSFEALGEVLAQIDWQSDLLRSTLGNVSRVRASKKEAINKIVMASMFNAAMKHLEKGGDDDELGAELSSLSIETSKDTVRRLEAKIMARARTSSNAYSLKNFSPFIAHYFLARNANDQIARRKAEQGLALWVEGIVQPFERIYAIANVALFKFYNEDRLEAIDETETALELFTKIPPPSDKSREFQKYWRRGNSIAISLAYYYAELVGTHDGRIADARSNAERCLQFSLDARARLASCPNSALVADDELRLSLNIDTIEKDIKQGYDDAGSAIMDEELAKLAAREMASNFNCIDCEIFVRTQLADTVEEIEELRKKLMVLHEKPPASEKQLAVQLFQFHEYCLRQRLAELE